MRKLGVMAAILLSLGTAAKAAEQTSAQAPVETQVAAEAVPSSLANMTPRSLVTMPVIGQDDETIGRVEDVVQDKRTGRLALLIRTDLDERLALDVQQIEAIDRQLRVQEGLGMDEVQQQIEGYDPSQFVVAADRDAELVKLQAAPSG